MIDTIRIIIAQTNAYHKNDLIYTQGRRYAKAYGLSTPQGGFVTGRQGKPSFLEGGPFFSVSHSGDYTVCAFGTKEIGVDIQKHQPCDCEAIARRHFHPLEYEWLKESDFSRFYDLWSAKESYVKFIGTGIDDSFSRILVTEPAPGIFQAPDALIYLISFLNDYSLCVCYGEKARTEVFAL